MFWTEGSAQKSYSLSMFAYKCAIFVPIVKIWPPGTRIVCPYLLRNMNMGDLAKAR